MSVQTGARLKLFREYKKLKQDELGDLIGKGGTITHLETGRTKIDEETLIGLINECSATPEDIYYILSGVNLGVGNGNGNGNGNDENKMLLSSNQFLHNSQNDFVKIQYYEQAFNEAREEMELQATGQTHTFLQEWFNTYFKIPKHEMAVIANDSDSMYPTIGNRDLLLIHLESQFKGDSIYCVKYGDSILIKRLQKGKNYTIKMISDNPIYENQIIDKEERESGYFNIIGKILWIGRTL